MNEPMTLENAMNPSVTFENLRMTSKQLFRLLAAVKK
jgi:glycerate kinase